MNALAFLENSIPNVLSGSAVLPLQSGDRGRRARVSDGEYRLILAVLEDAIQCYLNYWNEPYDIRKRRCAWEANRWIDSPSKTGIFAYENVCLLLEIEPDRLRQELRRLASRSGAVSIKPHSSTDESSGRRARRRRKRQPLEVRVTCFR